MDAPSLDDNGYEDPARQRTAVASLVSFSDHDSVRGQTAKRPLSSPKLILAHRKDVVGRRQQWTS